jgi:nucleotide-binding universal stress UspA family protein
VLLDGSDEARRAVQFVLPLIRNIDSVYFINAISGSGYAGRHPETVEMNYPLGGTNAAFVNETDRQLHSSKLALATAMAELNSGYANRPAPRMYSNIYYGSSITNAIENAIISTRADTVVMGSRGLGQKRGLGSISQWALENARANIIIAPPSSLDHKAMRHMHVRDAPYQK